MDIQHSTYRSKTGILCYYLQNNKSSHPDKHIDFLLEDCTLPLGVSDFNGNKSVLININEEQAQLIDDIYKQICHHFKDMCIDIENPIRQNKYGKQLKIKLNYDSEIYNEDKNSCDTNIFQKKDKITIWFKANMVWESKKQAGISFLCLQMMKLKNDPKIKSCIL